MQSITSTSIAANLTEVVFNFITPFVPSDNVHDAIERDLCILSYATEVVNKMQGEKADEQKISELRVSAQALPPFSSAEYGVCTLEECTLRAIEQLHDAWRRDHQPSQEDPQWYLCLPLPFIGWNSVKKYCEMLDPLHRCLRVTLVKEHLQHAYYEYAARHLCDTYHFVGFRSLALAMRNVACTASNITKIATEQCELLSDDAFVCDVLQEQLCKNGVGDFEKMKSFAHTYYHMWAYSCSRQATVMALRALA